MSDLVPFVAAVLRDKTVDDMKDELEKVRKQRDQQFLVHITGTNGFPIYYHGSLKDDGYNFLFEKRDVWAVDLKSNNDDDDDAGSSVPFNLVEELEVRFAGIVLQRLKIEKLRAINVMTRHFDEKQQMGWVSFENCFTNPIAEFVLKIGPIPFSTQQQEYETRGVPFLRNYLAEAFRRSSANKDVQGQDMNMIITKLLFRKSQISGILSLLQSIGVNTARTTPPNITTTCNNASATAAENENE